MIRIYHIADIHICKEKHEKIKFAIKQLLQKINNDELIKTPKAIYLVIAGDIFEHKNNYWGADLELWHEFLQKLEALQINTIIIPGNHDIYMENHEPHDLVSSSLINSRYENIQVFSKSNIYKTSSLLGTIIWHVYSPLDEEIPNETCNKNNLDIALVHESIRGAQLSSGIVDFKTRFCAQDLQHYDITMLGDIHRRQFLTPNVAYAGSFIQKTRGEDLFHGGICWTVKKTNSLVKFKIQSEVMNFKLHKAYVIMRINKSRVQSVPWQHVDSVSEIQIRYKNPDPEVLKQTQEKLKKRGRVISLDYSPVNNHKKQAYRLEADNHKLQIAAIRNHAPGREDIVQLHTEKMRNVQVKKMQTWRPVFMRWSNMYKYGENNEFNFENLQMVNSIVGKNMTGKSSILDIMILILYNETLRGIIPSAIRVGTSGFHGELDFQIFKAEEIQYYKIIRSYDKNKQTRAQLFINNQEQHFTSIKHLYDFVKTQIGELSSFKNICLRTQNASSWADYSGAILDKNLAACFDFRWLTSLQKTCKAELKEKEIQIRTLQKYLESLDNIPEIAKIKQELQNLNTEKPETITLLETDLQMQDLPALTQELNKLKTYKQDLREITQEFMKLNAQDLNTECLHDLQEITENKKQVQNRIEKLQSTKEKYISRSEDIIKLQSVLQKLPNNNPHEKKISESLQNIENDNFSWSYPEKPENARLQFLQNKFQDSQQVIAPEIYEKLKFKNTCSACSHNQEKLNTGTHTDILELTELQELKAQYEKDYNEYLQLWQKADQERQIAKTETCKYWQVQHKYEKFQTLNAKMIEYQNYEVRRNKKLKTLTEELDLKKRELEKLKIQEQEFYKNESKIKAKKRLEQLKILLPKLRRRDYLSRQIPRVEKNYKAQKINDKQNATYWKNMQKKQDLQAQIEKAKQKEIKLQELNEIQASATLLKDYVRVIDNKGIVRTMIHLHLKQLLPHINNMLSKLTDFTINFEIDNTPLLLTNDLIIPGNLSSGYQKFIVDLIMRIVLLKSNMTLPKILFIDEGFGCMDTHHLNLVKEFIEEFQENTENPKLIFISHLSEMRSMGKSIVIENSNNISTCVF